MPRRVKLGGKTAPKSIFKPIVIPSPPSEPTLLEQNANPVAGELYESDLRAYYANTQLQITKAKLEKLLTLLDHFEIKGKDSRCWLHLAYCLAEELPGFKVEVARKRGRNKKLNDSELLKLYKEVCDIKDKKKSIARSRFITDEEALKELKKLHPQKYPNIKAMKNNLSKARKSPLVLFIRNVEADPRTSHLVDECWDSFTRYELTEIKSRK